MTAAPEVIEVDGVAAGVRAVFTTRLGGVSTGACAGLNLGVTSGDDPASVRANRLALATACGVDAARAATVTQVHGADVLEVGPAGGSGHYVGDLQGVGEADALVTRAQGVALIAQGADCVPVVMWRADAGAVACAHAGWRGLVAGVLERAVAALGADQCGVAIGPCIGPCCYPVDASLRDAMATLFGDDVVMGDAVDLRLAARRALGRAGVDDASIVDVAACTSCDSARFYSYRRDGAHTGRQAGVIWRCA